MEICLSDLISRMYSVDFMYTTYHIPTKQLISLSDDMETDISEKILEDIESCENCIPIPEINQREIMKSYIFTLDNVSDQEELLKVFNKEQFYKNFKLTLSNLNLATDYFEYEESTYENEAIQWCETNDIEYRK